MSTEILNKIITAAKADTKKCPRDVVNAVMSSVRSEKPNAPRRLGVPVWAYPFTPAAAGAYLLIVMVLGGYITFRDPKTVEVTFTLHQPDASSVAIVGDFNHWTQEQGAMVKQDGKWVVTLAMKPGNYQYMFVVDGTDWIPDPASTDYVQSSFGDTNSLIEVRRG